MSVEQADPIVMDTDPAPEPRWTMHYGESLEVLRRLPDGSAHALITDPPYSSGGQFRGDRTQDAHTKYGVRVVEGGETTRARPEFMGDNRDQRSYAYWCSLWLSECQRVLVTGAPVVLFTDWRQLPITTDILQCGGFVWRGIAVWNKGEGTRPFMGGFRSQCEYMVWGSNGPRDEAVDQEVGCLPGVLQFPVRQDDKHHVTGKPTDLMRAVVRLCRPGGVVLDPFAGSGTTILAALAEGRRGVGIEKVREYYEISRDRCLAYEERRDFLQPQAQPGLFERRDA